MKKTRSLYFGKQVRVGKFWSNNYFEYESEHKSDNTFISSTDKNKERVIYSESDNEEIKINDKADEVIAKLFKSLLNRYQSNLETSKRGSDFLLDYVHLFYFNCYKINCKWVGSYWILIIGWNLKK